MNLTGLYLVILGLLSLVLVVLVGWLVRFLIQSSEKHSSVMLELQDQMSQSLNRQLLMSHQNLMAMSQEMKTTLLDSLQLAQSVTAGQFKHMMLHQEVLVNRLIAKDAVTVQALDSRSIVTTTNQSPQASEVFINSTDEEEYERYRNFARHGDTYDSVEEDALAADLNVAGL